MQNKSWKDVTIEMWQELSLVESDFAITKFIEQLAIVTDKDPEDIRAMKPNDFFTFKEEHSFLHTPPENKVTTKFELDGKLYGIIPNLQFITAGEWIDAETWKEKSVENMHLFAALLFRPVVKEEGDYYEIEPHQSKGFLQRAELFRKKLSIEVIHGSVIFFSTSVISSTKVILDYLQDQKLTT